MTRPARGRWRGGLRAAGRTLGRIARAWPALGRLAQARPALEALAAVAVLAVLVLLALPAPAQLGPPPVAALPAMVLQPPPPSLPPPLPPRPLPRHPPLRHPVRVPGRVLVPMPLQRVDDGWARERWTMVNQQLRQRGISQPEVLAAMEQVPRHLFVPQRMWPQAYQDRALPVGPERTVYQPYVVALMTSLLDLKRGDRVLEIGTGSGYHAAVLSRIASQVYSVEIDPRVAEQAGRTLAGMGYRNVVVRVGDGYLGLPDKAPFDAILLSAAPPHIPQPLIDQLRPGGKMVVPVGGYIQDLLVITKRPDGGIEKKTVVPIRVSPMTGKVQDGH
jgi:protein-L-isoaspartate(D-aspartate) O-methyltransferase